jgi:chromosome segregation ATPase
MSENNEKLKSTTYIKNGKYLFNMIKVIPQSSTHIEKIGITIYKKTLEINILNKDSIDLILNTNSNFVESCVDIGFINLHGILCYFYASNNDIKEKEKIIESLNEKQNNDIISMKNEFENEKKIMMEKYDIINEKNINMEKEYNLLKEENYKLIEELNKYKEKEKEKENNNANVEKDKIITLEKENSELNKTITELNNKINELNTKIKELESKKNKNIDINQVMKDSEIVKLVNNYDTQLKKIGNDLANKNKDEVKNLENKLKSLQAKYDMILLERESLKKNIIYLKGKKYDPDSYEEVLKEQFETMRNAFIQKIDDLNEELTDIKRNSRIQIYQLELELKENVRLKNNFLKQIISLQSQLDSLNK